MGCVKSCQNLISENKEQIVITSPNGSGNNLNIKVKAFQMKSIAVGPESQK